uniref:Uncharacterized protein n=1 Tax=Aegilops tauschii subsp. strangulata TaxID=200361 RepID=A0A453I3F1_AEGTS
MDGHVKLSYKLLQLYFFSSNLLGLILKFCNYMLLLHLFKSYLFCYFKLLTHDSLFPEEFDHSY